MPDDNSDSLDVQFITDTARGAGSQRTRLIIGGQDVTPFTRAVTFHSSVDELNRVTVELLPRDGFTFAAPVGVVALEVTVFPGYRLIREQRGDRDVFRTEREDSDG
jgi:hypothetical protein